MDGQRTCKDPSPAALRERAGYRFFWFGNHDFLASFKSVCRPTARLKHGDADELG
jgi:hypothetical protein